MKVKQSYEEKTHIRYGAARWLGGRDHSTTRNAERADSPFGIRFASNAESALPHGSDPNLTVFSGFSDSPHNFSNACCFSQKKNRHRSAS